MDPFSKTIAVFGSSAITQESEGANQARQLGALLAQKGFKICNGGYCGAMEASSQGAKEAGGQVIGVTSEIFSSRTPSTFITEEVMTPDLLERITTLMRIADGYIVLDGGIGTLAELFLAWNLVALGWDRPLVVVGDTMKDAIIGLKRYTEVVDKHIDLLQFAATVEEAAQKIENHFVST